MIGLLPSIRDMHLSNWAVVVVCLLTTSGCGGGSSGQTRNEKLSKASGVVTVNGKPVDAGIVSFSNPFNGFSASGDIELAGKFTITLIPTGDYRVSISPPMPKEAVDPTSLPQSNSEISPKYQNPTTSGLQATVPPEGVTNLKFELQ